MAYEFDGDKYRKASNHQKEWGEGIISEFSFKGSESILDLGCGEGRLTAALADCVPEGSVVGIDASTNMIATAQKTYKKTNLAFELFDIDCIEYKEKFDLVFSNAALHWVTDHHKLLGNIFKALKNGGIVRFNFAGDGNCSNFFRVVKKVIKMPEYKEFFINFKWPWFMPEISEYQELVSKFGFSENKVWFENADRNFENKEAIVGWLDQPSLVPFLGFVPDEMKKKFRDCVVDLVLADTAVADGKYFETFRRINLFAVK